MIRPGALFGDSFQHHLSKTKGRQIVSSIKGRERDTQMDGWMDGWMDGLTDRQIDRQIERDRDREGE